MSFICKKCGMKINTNNGRMDLSLHLEQNHKKHVSINRAWTYFVEELEPA